MSIGAASMSCMVFAWLTGDMAPPAVMPSRMPSPVRFICLRPKRTTSGE